MMLPISTLATAAAGAAAVVLSGASMFNMYEMLTLSHENRNNKQLSLTSVPSDMAVEISSWNSIDKTLQGLKTMSRRDLISLYFQCDHPDIDDVVTTCNEQAEDGWVYDGYLLSNGPILSFVTNFITNVLFGRGSKWLGKVYFSSSSIGKNRFRQDQNKESKIFKGFLDRTFDYRIGKSALCSNLALINRYSPHCSKWSPVWRGMVDELRVIPLSFDTTCVDVNSGQTQNKVMVLLGMGYFTWSGGAWNSAPFCLVAKRVE